MTERPHPAWVPTRFTAEELRAVLDVELASADLLTTATSLPTEHGGVLGAQMLGQMVAACESATPGKSVATMTMHFLRASHWQAPLHIQAQRLSDGRRLSVLQVDFSQGERLIARGEALLGVEDTVDTSDDTDDPDDRQVGGARALWPWEIDASSPTTDEVDLWARIPWASGSPRESRALLAYATESLTVPLAIDRCGLREIGGSVPQVVVSHAVTFVSGIDVRRWHRHRSEVISREKSMVTGSGEVSNHLGDPAVLTQTIAMIGERNERLLADHQRRWFDGSSSST